MAIINNSLSGGGAEYSAELLYEELRKRSLSVFWVGINSENPRNVQPNERIICLDRNKKGGLSETIGAYVRFINFVYANKISTLIVNCELPELYSAFLPKKVQMIIVEHANPSWYNRDFLGRIVRRILSLRKSINVVVGSHLSPRFSKDKLCIFIPNPLPDLNAKFQNNATGEIRRLLFVGRLSPDFKHPRTVLELGIRLGIPTAFIGSGPLRDELEASASRAKANTVFLGYQEFPWKFYRDGDLLIIPSSAEGDGLVLIEAIQRSVPFLATNIPDLNRYGISAMNYCKDIEEFAFRIETYRHRLDELVVPEKLATKIIEERSLSKIADAWVSLLNRLDAH